MTAGSDVKSDTAPSDMNCTAKATIRPKPAAMNAEYFRVSLARSIFPEIEIGKRTAMRLCEALAEDILPLSDEFSILQMKTPDALDGKSVGELGIRGKYGISIIATVKDGKANGNIGPDTVLSKDETLVISGSNRSLDRFQANFS